MTPEDLAWLAGLFDGEGHISVLTKLSQRANGVKIQVTNTNRELLEEISRITGVGYITLRPRKNPRWKPTYDWHTTGGNAKELLRLMASRLIAKRARAFEAMR